MSITGSYIRPLRRKYHTSQEELSQLLGVSRQTISSLENGHPCPSLTLAYDLSKVFNCRIEDLFIFDDLAIFEED